MVKIISEGPQGFYKVTNVGCLLSVLESRLPRSCNVYNMAQRHPRFQMEMTFYVLNPQGSKSSWIVATYLREDYGMDINISSPSDQRGICDFKEALISTRIIDWSQPFVFAAIHEDIVQMVQEVIFERMGKHAKANPNILYYATPGYFNRLSNNNSYSSNEEKVRGIEVKALNAKEGADYLHDNWKFATKGSLTYIRKLVERNGAEGVLKDGTIISGVTLNGSGLISMLSTLPTHRQMGYALICMSSFIRTLDKENLVPCCTVEFANAASNALQRKLGLSYSHDAFYISRPE